MALTQQLLGAAMGADLAAATAHGRWRLGRGLEHHPGRRNAAER